MSNRTYSDPDGRVRLSRVERLMLSNQYRILEALYPDEAKDYAHAREVVDSGYEMDYESLAQHIYEPPMSFEACEEVWEILTMHQMLRDAYDDMEDKSGIDLHKIEFMGFDGNNETKQIGYCRFIFESGERFTNIKTGFDGYNSHMPTLDTYRRMLAEYHKSKTPYRLTREDVERIIAARIHPENR